jgi:hypothetical protein
VNDDQLSDAMLLDVMAKSLKLFAIQEREEPQAGLSRRRLQMTGLLATQSR